MNGSRRMIAAIVTQEFKVKAAMTHQYLVLVVLEYMNAL